MRNRPFAVLAVIAAALALSTAALAVGESPSSAPSKPESGAAGSASAVDPATRVVRVYYFRTNTRCASCKKIEAFTDEAVRGGFARELEAGEMTWEVVNIQEPGSEHFVKDYQLYAKSVVVVDTVGGHQVRWKNLARIWEMLDDRPAFARYVQDEVRQYLEDRP